MTRVTFSSNRKTALAGVIIFVADSLFFVLS